MRPRPGARTPWRCPVNCPSYRKDIIDSTFVVGSLVRPQIEAEPDVPESDVAGALDGADLIVTAGEGEIVKEIDRERGVQALVEALGTQRRRRAQLGRGVPAPRADGEVCGNGRPATAPIGSRSLPSTAPGGGASPNFSARSCQ